jgi:hypothetical protein
LKIQTSPIWALEPGQGARPGKAPVLLILLWTSIALLVGELGSFSIPFVGQASLFWPAMVFQTVGGLWFGGLGILSAMIFPLVSNALSGFPWPQNIAWMAGNFIQGGLLRFVKDFDKIRLMVRAHHEHYDGSGYPDGLKGLEIPLGARIIAVADVYDALTTDRPYRAAWKKEKALQVIQENIGSQFDPQVGPVFISIMRQTRFNKISGEEA